jgi:hypothetical protein
VGDRAYEHDVQIDVDVSASRNGFSRLHCIVIRNHFRDNHRITLPQEKVRAARSKEHRHHRHIVQRHTHVEAGLDKRVLADRNVHRRIHRGVLCGGSCVAENGKIVEVSEIPTRR